MSSLPSHNMLQLPVRPNPISCGKNHQTECSHRGSNNGYTHSVKESSINSAVLKIRAMNHKILIGQTIILISSLIIIPTIKLGSCSSPFSNNHPYAPCREYLPTISLACFTFHVRKKSIHGASGSGFSSPEKLADFDPSLAHSSQNICM